MTPLPPLCAALARTIAPIPVRCCDWQFWHDDFDGAPMYGDEGPADNRCGSAASEADAKAEIDAWIEENEGDAAH